MIRRSLSAIAGVKTHYHSVPWGANRLWVFSVGLSIACAQSVAARSQVANSQLKVRIQEHFLAAQQAQQQGRLDDAAGEYKEVLRLQPRLPEAYANLGLVYYAHGEFEDSARAFAAAEKLRPGMRGMSLWLGIDEVRLNRPAQGVIHLREAIRLDPKEKLAQSWLGTALWDAGQIDAALSQLRKAAAQFPDDPDLLFALGEAYGKAAKQQSEALLEDSSGKAISDRIYGSIYAADHDWTKAEGHLRRAIERDPRSLDARLELAEVLLEQAHLPAAQEQLEDAATLAPRSASVFARSGELLILSGHSSEGLSRIDQALAANRSEALYALGIPGEDLVGSSEAAADLLALCRDAEKRLNAMETSSAAKDVALAALYTRSGDDAAAARAYARLPAPLPQIEKPTASHLRPGYGCNPPASI